MANTDWTSLARRYYGSNFGKPGYTTLSYMKSTGNNWFGLSKQLNPFSKGNIGGPKGMAAMAAIGLGINLAGTALNKGVTNETGQILSTAGSGLMAIPTPYTMAAGLVLSGAGVIANGLTDRVNTQYQKAKNAEISQIGDWTSGAEDYRGLQLEMSNFGTVDLGDLDNWGDIGFLSSGSNVKGARAKAGRALLAATGMRQLGVNSRGQYINMRNTYNLLGHLTAFGGPIDVDPSTPIGYSIYTDRAIKDKQKDNSAMTNMFAGTSDMFGFGGGIYTKGANFDTGVSFINTGGTHEENPNEGVQMGVDSQGVPNLVEEGEVRWGDYMFSDRLIVPRGKRGNYGKRARKYAEGGKLVKGKGIDTPYESKVLKPYEGLTFADAAKKILKRNGADERDDAITMRGIDAELSVLAGILEKEREKEKLREMEETIDNMSPEEFAMLQQQMEAQQAALQQQEMAMQQLQMIPEGMELMQPIEQQQPIAALGGLLNTPDNMYPYGGSLDEFLKELSNYGLTLDDYLQYWGSQTGNTVDENTKLTTDNLNRDIAEKYLDRIETITKQYNRRAKRQGIKVEDLQGATKAQYDRELNQAIQRGLTDADYNVSQDTELTFNNSNVSKAKNSQQAYNNAATYKDLIARGGRAVKLDDLGRPTWESMAGLSKIDNSAEGFYDKLGELDETALGAKGVYDYTASTPSSIADKDNLKLYGWQLGEEGNYAINKDLVSPNEASRTAGNTSSTYKPSDLGDLTYGAEGYKEALDAIQGDLAYKDLTSYVLLAIKDAEGDYSKLPSDILNYIEYLDANTGNKEAKLLTRDKDGNITGIADNASQLYDKRRNDNIYGIYHYQFDKGNNAAANRYYYKDGDLNVYISKPEGTDFTISENPTVVTGTDGTLFNDYEVTGLNKNRTLTLLPTGEVVDVTDLADLPNWRKLDKPVLVDNTDNLGYGIKGATDWVDYGSSPVGQKVIDDENPFPKPSSWPFGLAAALQLGSLGYNILKPADYSNANALLSAAKEAGTYTPISPLFAGQRLPYKPAPDTKFGKIVGVGLGNARSIINNSRGNIGATQAGLLQNALNTQLALGEADEAWRQGNWNMLKDVLTFGLQRDTSNYDRDLKAKMSNQDAASRAAGYSLEGQRAAYAMRQAIDDAKANAINAGFSGLTNLAYNYGTNRDQIKLLGWLGKSGANGPMDMSKYGRKPAAHGGRIRRKKGLSF